MYVPIHALFCILLCTYIERNIGTQALPFSQGPCLFLSFQEYVLKMRVFVNYFRFSADHSPSADLTFLRHGDFFPIKKVSISASRM